MNIQDSLEDGLKKFGCTRKEAKIYIDIYSHGACTVQSIAKRINLNRITVHSAIEQLIEKQLIAESREGKRRTLFVESTARLKEAVDEKLQDLLRVRESADNLISLFEKLPKQNHAQPDIHIYHGLNGYKKLLEEVLEAKGEARIFVDIEQLQKLLTPEYLITYYKRRAAKNIFTKMIWPDCNFTKKIIPREKEYKIKIHAIKKPKNWRVGFYSWNDKVGITCFVEGQIICTVIKNKEIAWFYQHLIYDSLWEMLG